MKLLITSLLVKIETTPGVDSVPTGAANAVLLRGQPTLTPLEAALDQRNIILPYFGNMGSMLGAAFGKLDFQFELAGTGTAGTAPAYGPILRACAVGETLTAAPVAGTAQAGGSTTSIKLAATSSAVNGFYNGFPISITAGTGTGQSGVVVAYNGATQVATVASVAWVAPDATSTYSMSANAAYRPVTNSLEAVTLYFNIDGVLHKFVGARGTVSFNIGADKIPYAKASLTGIYVPVTDAAAPVVVLTGWQRPLISNTVNTPLFSMLGYSAAVLDTLTLDLVNTIAKVSRIGVQRVDITDRKPVGNVSMEAVLTATHNWWQACLSSTPGPLALINGTTAGNCIALSAPVVVPTAPKYANSNGIAMIQMGFDITPNLGNDELALVVY